MKLLINLPSRSRPRKCLNILDSYLNMSTHEDTHFIISCDIDDETMNNDSMISAIKSKPKVDICFNENKIIKNNQKSNFTTKINAINSGVKGREFDICLLASDDMHPEEKGFDSIITTDMTRHFPDTDGVLWYNDGYQGEKLNTLCILGKKYFDRFNYIYHPSYITLYCDDEFTQVSKRLKKCKYIDKTIIRHKHWSHADNQNQRDSLDVKNDVFACYDQNNFEQRKSKGFPE